MLKVNEDEWNNLKELKNCTGDIELCKRLEQDYRIQQVILTKGSDGAALIHKGNIVDVPVASIPDGKFKDPIGAGDGFLAAFLNHFIHTENGEESLEKASEYASLICQNQGAILP